MRRDYVDKNRDEVNAKQREALDKKIEENPDFYKDYYSRNKERICDYTEKKRREA